MSEIQKQELTKKLLEIAKKEIGIIYRTSDAPLSTAGSKIGGMPDVPQWFEWPWFSGRAYGEEESDAAFSADIQRYLSVLRSDGGRYKNKI